jgi:hypothetical protein
MSHPFVEWIESGWHARSAGPLLQPMDSLTCKRGARRLAKNQSQNKALSPNSSREQALPYPYIYAAVV